MKVPAERSGANGVLDEGLFAKDFESSSSVYLEYFATIRSDIETSANWYTKRIPPTMNGWGEM
eukprot:6458996-Amphidinium_carterae.1